MCSDHKTIPLLGGWHFSEYVRQGGVSSYILMSPDGLAGSEEYNEKELDGLLADIRLNDRRQKAADDNIRVLQGIARVLGLPDYTDVTPEAVAARMNEAP